MIRSFPGWSRIGRIAHRPTPSSTGRVALFAWGKTATVDYFFGSFLPNEVPSMATFDLQQPPPSEIPLVDSAILVRYLPSRWKQFFARLSLVTPIFYFMDDDLMDPKAVLELTEPYRSRVRRDALKQRKVIESLCSEFWVSTPHLADKYAHWNAKVISPRPAAATLSRQSQIWVCYHGTASHRSEMEWLLPVMQQIQSGTPSVRFEVFGDHAVYTRFRVLPRINVLHPMTWPNYLDYTTDLRREIGLAPLLPSRFNAGRGPTKFFDFARMRAVGLYTDVAPYRGFVRNGVDGLLLPNEPAEWVQAVLNLVQDPPRRERMATAAHERALELSY